MKSGKTLYLKRLAGLLTICLILLVIQVPARGATNCEFTDVITGVQLADSDCDGFSNLEEESANGVGLTGLSTDPAKPDLFVTLEPLSSGSLMTATSLDTLIKSAGDIGLIVHKIDKEKFQSQTFRNVTNAQKGVRIVENGYVGAYLGQSPVGNPDSTDDTAVSTVYTKKIQQTVTGLCTPPKGKALDCKDADKTSGLQAVTDKYISHTIAHEAGHQVNLKYTCATDIGCHYPTITATGQTPKIIDQSVFYVKGTSSITWYIGSVYDASDSNFQLRPVTP